MDLKSKIRDILSKQYGTFETVLEHQYENKLTENLIDGTKDLREEWATYNQVVIELKHSIKDMLKVKELQYKLSEDTNPREVIIEVIEGLDGLTPELNRLYDKIKSFNSKNE